MVWWGARARVDGFAWTVSRGTRFSWHVRRRKSMVAWMGGARVAGFEELYFLGLSDVSS